MILSRLSLRLMRPMSEANRERIMTIPKITRMTSIRTSVAGEHPRLLSLVSRNEAPEKFMQLYHYLTNRASSFQASSF